jgi:hypothetical protein
MSREPGIIIHMSDTGFFRDKHNLQKSTAPANHTNSVFPAHIVPDVSAYVTASGFNVAQPGSATGRLAYVLSYSAEIRPSGSTTATGYSHLFFIAKVGRPDAHLMAYPVATIWKRYASKRMIPTGNLP